jgi:SagB-type dehydrogenase family enzyme
VKVRLPLDLCVVNVDGDLLFYDPGSGRRWDASALDDEGLAAVLSFCTAPTPRNVVEDYAAGVTGRPLDEVRQAVDMLLDAGLLIADTDGSAAKEAASCERWAARGWEEPFRYHRHTVRSLKMDYAADPRGEADKALMKSYLEAEPQPALYKESDAARIVPLSRGDVRGDASLAAAAGSGTLSERAGSEPLDAAALGWLTYFAFGETGKRFLPISGRHVGKTSPSGGSRHPTEAYAIVLAVPGIDAGLYHYRVRDHALALVEPGDHRAFVARQVIPQPGRPGFEPSVVFVLSTIFERSMFRYRESRSYRVVHHDVGHVLQTLAFLARSIGRRSYRSYSFHDQPVEAFLGIDGLHEAVMSVAAIG